MVYWSNQDAQFAAVGGVLIALATTLNYWLQGKLTGISGMIDSVLHFMSSKSEYFKYLFLTGLVTVPKFMNLFYGDSITFRNGTHLKMFDNDADAAVPLSALGWLIAGLLVGFGTRMGNGCTSGHGVCGLPRLSKRSIAATLTFMGFAAMTATLRFNRPFLHDYGSFIKGSDFANIWEFVGVVILIGLHVISVFLILRGLKDGDYNLVRNLFATYIYGILFGTGLLLSGMLRFTKVLGFLTIDSRVWDPTLMVLMGTAVVINFITFRLINRRSKPVWENAFTLPDKHNIDWQLITGSAIFGIGWGLAGICPGPGFTLMLIKTIAAVWFVGFISGDLLYTHVVKKAIDKRRSYLQMD